MQLLKYHLIMHAVLIDKADFLSLKCPRQGLGTTHGMLVAMMQLHVMA